MTKQSRKFNGKTYNFWYYDPYFSMHPTAHISKGRRLGFEVRSVKTKGQKGRRIYKK